jgi:hypothetical protein
LINQARAEASLPPAALLGPKLYPLLRTTAYRDILVTSRSNQDVFSLGQINTQSITVRNIPTDGRPIFVILLSLAEGRWYTQEYRYTAAADNLATPIISPNGGTFRRRVKVKLTEITPGAAIFYTTDGSTPTVDSTLYQSPFILKRSSTVKAIAITLGVFTGSDVATASFIIRCRH